METINVKIDELKAPDLNTRKHGVKQIQEMKRSLEMFGQIRPVVIDEENTVWCGNGLWIAAQELGWSEVSAYRVTGLDKNMKRKLMLADNKVFQLGFDDVGAIDQVMAELGDFQIPGYDEATLQSLYSTIEVAAQEVKEYGQIDVEDVQRINETAFARTDAETREVTPAAPPIEEDEAIVVKEHEPDLDAPVRAFVLCPKCGEKIWL